MNIPELLKKIAAARALYGELRDAGIISVENGSVHCQHQESFSSLAEGAPVRAEWGENNRLYLYATRTDGMELVYLPDK